MHVRKALEEECQAWYFFSFFLLTTRLFAPIARLFRPGCMRKRQYMSFLERITLADLFDSLEQA